MVGIEPSCLLTLRDEFLALLPGEETRRWPARAAALGIPRARGEAGRFDAEAEPPRPRAHVHGHCHQKAFGAFPAAVEAMLPLVPGLKVEPITSSCCGMAGSFGYEAEHQDVSKAMAELVAAAGGARRRARTHWSSPTAPPAATRSPTSPGARRVHVAHVLAEAISWKR